MESIANAVVARHNARDDLRMRSGQGPGLNQKIFPDKNSACQFYARISGR